MALRLHNLEKEDEGGEEERGEREGTQGGGAWLSSFHCAGDGSTPVGLWAQARGRESQKGGRSKEAWAIVFCWAKGER